MSKRVKHVRPGLVRVLFFSRRVHRQGQTQTSLFNQTNKGAALLCWSGKIVWRMVECVGKDAGGKEEGLIKGMSLTDIRERFIRPSSHSPVLCLMLNRRWQHCAVAIAAGREALAAVHFYIFPFSFRECWLGMRVRMLELPFPTPPIHRCMYSHFSLPSNPYLVGCKR